MPPLTDKAFYINTEKNGILADTTPADVRTLVENLPGHQKLVWHFHGGLVSQSGALESAARLKTAYESVGAYPTFFVWESDFLRVVKDNLEDINQEKIFKQLVKWLIKFTLGKLGDMDGGKATGQLQLPNDIEVAIELKKADNGEEPYANVAPTSALKPLNDAEKAAFEQALTADPRFQAAVNDVVAAATPENTEQRSNAKGVLTVSRASGKTLMSPEIVSEIETDVAANAGKGVLSTAVLLKHAGSILLRVINRFVDKHDHGVYCTVVEELLRELYLANVGTTVWGMMKKETADTFENAGQKPERGGWFFIDTLSEKLAAGYNPQITLVGHSAGSIYIYNLLRYVEKARTDPNHPLPETFKFDTIIFEAPALDCLKFADMVKNYRHLFTHFRMFTMSDDGEKGKAMVPVLYPRSLLYFISGVLERDYTDPDKLADDQPIAGMQRYINEKTVYTAAEIATIRKFLAEDDRRVVWATDNRGDGLASAATQHSGFSEEPQTLSSVQHILQHGWA